MQSAQIQRRNFIGRFHGPSRARLTTLLVVAQLAATLFAAAADNAAAPQAPNDAERTRFRDAAKAALQSSNLKDVETYYEAAWAASEGFGVKDHRYQESLRELGVFLAFIGKAEAADKLFRQAMEATREAHREKYLEGGFTMYFLGYTCFQEGKYDEAEKLLLEAKKVLGLLKGAYDISTGVCLTRLAEVYAAQGRYSEAEPMFRKAIAIFANPKVTTKFKDVGTIGHQAMTWVLTPNPHFLAEQWRLLAQMYVRAGRFTEAEIACYDSMKAISKNVGAESQDMAIAKVALAEVYIREKKYGEAEGVLKEALEMIGARFGPDAVVSADALIEFAELDRAQLKWAEADLHLRRAFDTLKSNASRPNKMLSIVLYDSSVGRMNDAEALLALTLDIEEKVFADEPLQLATYVLAAARAKSSWSKLAESAALYKRSLGLFEKKWAENDRQLLPVLGEYEGVLRKLGRKSDSDAVQARIDAIKAAAKPSPAKGNS